MANWTAEIETKTALVDTTSRETGLPAKMKVTHKYVVVSRGREDGKQDAIRFHVYKRGGSTWLTDNRAAETGHRPAAWNQSTGPCKGERYSGRGGRPEALSAQRWASEVERLIGWERAIGVLAELGAL